MSIFLFIIILAVLILVHELGHFLFAKRAGIRVDEFGIGFPPKLYGKKIGETEYTLNATFIGGFVRIFGETPNEESLSGPDSERSLVRKPKRVQALVLSAGVLFNLLLAWALISAGFLIGLPSSASAPLSGSGEMVSSPALTVIETVQNSPADKAGIKAGDRVLTLSDSMTTVSAPTADDLQNFIAARGGKKIQLELSRGGETRTVEVVPEAGIIKQKPAIGIAMDMIGIMRLPFIPAVLEGGKLTLFYTGETFKGLYALIHDSIAGKADLSAVSGPVGIVGYIGDASKMGVSYVIALTAIISINLAAINILPIPALDGGRLFFLLIEAVRRKPIKPKTANAVNAAGFVLLLILIALVTYNDIAKIVWGG